MKRIKRLAVFFALLLIAVSALLTAVYFKYSRDLPDVRDIPDPIQSSKIYSDDGTLIAEIYTQKRTVVKSEDIPEMLVNSIIAIEDQRFYSHNGIDPYAIIRAFLKNIEKGRIAEGASTITMQTARNIFLTRFKSLDRKLKEAILALRLEKSYSKSEIMAIYLNNIYFGMGSYGVYEAARTYFKKALKDLSIEECALIAALPKAPYTYNPYRNRKIAKNRRDLVLKNMYDLKFIDFNQYSRAVTTPVTLAGEERETGGSYFIDFVRANLINIVGEQNLYEGGLRIKTTISNNIQKKAEESLRKGLIAYQRKRPFKKSTVIYDEEKEFIKDIPGYRIARINDLSRYRISLVFEDNNETGYLDINNSGFSDIKDFSPHFEAGERIMITTDPESNRHMLMPLPEAQASLIAIDLKNNSIIAMAGGFSYEKSQFNRAVQAKRQPGSAFKPFVFLSALIYGYSPIDTTYDLPLLVTEYSREKDPDLSDGWKPSNFDGQYLGSISFATALFESRNIVAVRLAQELTTFPVKYLAVLAGINSHITPHLSMSLGSASISLIELCHAYTIFPNQGRLLPLRYITDISDRDDRKKELKTPFARNIVLPQYAYIMVRLLTGVIDFGTGSMARPLGFETAGKTGTSNDFRDNWFIGFTPQILVGVWVGKDNFESLGRNFTGGTTACPIFTDFLSNIDLGPSQYFHAPNGVFTYPLDINGMMTCSPERDTSFQALTDKGLFIESPKQLEGDEDITQF